MFLAFFFPVQRLEILRIATRSSAESLKTWRLWPVFTSSFWDVQTEVNGIKICPKPLKLFTDGYYIYIHVYVHIIYIHMHIHIHIYIYTYRFYIVFVSLIDIFIFFDTDPNQQGWLFVLQGRFRSERMDPSDSIFFQTKNPEAFGHSAVSPVRFQGWEGSRLMGLLLAR